MYGEPKARSFLGHALLGVRQVKHKVLPSDARPFGASSLRMTRVLFLGVLRGENYFLSSLSEAEFMQ